MIRTLILEGERPVSWNDYYAGLHWAQRKAEADRVHQLVRSQLDPNDTPFERPVKVTVTVYFANRPQDSGNIFTKPYVDGLLVQGVDGFRAWLWGDDRELVVSTTTISRVDKKRPRVEIELVEVE